MKRFGKETRNLGISIKMFFTHKTLYLKGNLFWQACTWRCVTIVRFTLYFVIPNVPFHTNADCFWGWGRPWSAASHCRSTDRDRWREREQWVLAAWTFALSSNIKSFHEGARIIRGEETKRCFSEESRASVFLPITHMNNDLFYPTRNILSKRKPAERQRVLLGDTVVSSAKGKPYFIFFFIKDM